MQLTYAGIPLLLSDPDGRVQAFLDRNLSLWDTTFFSAAPVAQKEGRERPRNANPYKVGLPTPNWSYVPRPKLNTLWWPTGASRFGIGLFLADGYRTKAILDTIQSTQRDFQTLTFADELFPERTVSTPLWLLPPWEIDSAGPDETLYVLPLVDQRYFWQFVDVGTVSVTSATSWDGLLSSLRNRLYGELDFTPPFAWEPIVAAYLQPDPTELTRKYENFAVYLDAVAACIGQRVVADLNGDLRLLDWAASDVRRADNVARVATRAYGELAIAGAFNEDVWQHKRGRFPRQVRVVYPVYANGVQSATGEVHAVTVSTAAYLPGEAVTWQATKTFYDTAAADFSGGGGSPVNYAELDALTARIASDYCQSILYDWEVSLAGVEPWEISGWDDSLWFHTGFQDPVETTDAGGDGGQYHCFTRIATFPVDFGLAELLHQTAPAASSTSTSASSTPSSSSVPSSSSSPSSSLSSGSSSSSSSSSGCATGTFDIVVGIECCNGQLYVKTRSITIYPNGTFCFGAATGPICSSSSSSV